MLDDALLRQILRQVRAISCNALQHMAAHGSPEIMARWQPTFLDIAIRADESLDEQPELALEERGFGSPAER